MSEQNLSDGSKEEWDRRWKAALEASHRRHIEWMEAQERRAQHFKRYRWLYRPLIGLGVLLAVFTAGAWGWIIGTLVGTHMRAECQIIVHVESPSHAQEKPAP